MHTFLNEVEVGKSFSGVYYLENVFEKLAKNGNKYTDLMCKDKSKTTLVRYWGSLKDINKDNFIKITANVETYLGNPQIIAQSISLFDGDINSSLYLQVIDNYEEKEKEFLEIIQKLSEKHTIIEHVFTNEFKEEFCQSPCGMNYYGKVGSLIENTLNTIKLAENIANGYGLNEVEKEVLELACICSKIGIPYCYNQKIVGIEETEVGLLLGDVLITFQILTKIFENTSYEFKDRLLHCIASFKAKDVKPMTKEAMILAETYFADLRMVECFDYIQNDKNEGNFTAPDPIYKRRYYKN